MIFGLNCLERLFPTPLFAACHLLQGLFLFSAVKRSQFGPCSSGCWEEELLPSCCRGEFPATLKCPRKGWKQNEAWQRTVPGRIVLSELCSAQVRISVSSGLSYMAEEVGSVCQRQTWSFCGPLPSPSSGQARCVVLRNQELSLGLDLNAWIWLWP